VGHKTLAKIEEEGGKKGERDNVVERTFLIINTIVV